MPNATVTIGLTHACGLDRRGDFHTSRCIYKGDGVRLDIFPRCVPTSPTRLIIETEDLTNNAPVDTIRVEVLSDLAEAGKMLRGMSADGACIASSPGFVDI